MSTETFIDGLVRYIKIKEMEKTIKAVKPIKEGKDYFKFDISYNNIDLHLQFYFDDDDENLEKIFIDEFDRTSEIHGAEPRAPTDKGDGALLLALTIIHINKNYKNKMNNVIWWGFFTPWWFTHGPCTDTETPCMVVMDSQDSELPETTIINNNFLTWANKIYTEN